MRKAVTIFFLIFFQLVSFSQNKTDKLTNFLNESANYLPADQVFLHTDRNLYFPGDTIRFEAYIRDRQTGICETNSISLYSLLLNSVHQTIDSARFRINSSTASGWLSVPETITSGNYTIIAFTSRMMNYSPEYVFSAPIRIDKVRSRQTQFKQNADKISNSSYQIPGTQQTVNLRFLPEGGTFIYGISQRLAFNAVTSSGRTLEIEGDVLNQRDEKTCHFKSVQFGPGLLEFTPVQGDTYHAILHGEEFTGMKWPLPIPENSGVALRVNTGEEGLIDIITQSRGVTGKTFYLSLIMNNVLVQSKEFQPDSTWKIKITTAELPSGTAYITLFNNELDPVAERLVFVNDHKKMQIELTTPVPNYNRGEETELTLNTIDNKGNNVSSVVSISVIDSLSGYYNTSPLQNIESTFLFEKEFYNNLPFKIRQYGLNNIDERNIDLLLMTYGWRKFKTTEKPEVGKKMELVDYDYLKIKNPGLEKKARSDIKLVAIEGSEIYNMKTDKNNEAIFYFDTLDVSVRQVMVIPDNNPTKNVNPIRIEFPENKDFTNKAKLIEGYKNDFIIDSPLQKKIDTDFGLDSAIMIEAVTIKGSKGPPQPYYNKYQKEYQFANTVTISKKEMAGCFNFEDILVRLHPYQLDTRNKTIQLRPGLGSFRQGPNALFIVDDVPLYNEKGRSTYSLIATMPAEQISSVTALKGSRGFTFYGEDAIGGVIFVTTVAKQMSEGNFYDFNSGREKIINDLMKPIRIFRI